MNDDGIIFFIFYYFCFTVAVTDLIWYLDYLPNGSGENIAVAAGGQFKFRTSDLPTIPHSPGTRSQYYLYCTVLRIFIFISVLNCL